MIPTSLAELGSAIRKRLARLTANRSVAARGERTAARHLTRRGYRILGRNLRNRFGEVDILAEDPDRRTVVVVEVKATGNRTSAYRPEAHVTHAKQRKLVALAAQLARRYHLTDRPIRFDVVGVDCPGGTKPTVRHHIGAFQSHV